jgi:hypothetical protein
MSDQQQAVEQDVEQRITYLDVVEQQLASMKQQAIATITSCDSAIKTVQLLRSQLDSARKVAEDRRKAQSAEPKRPATFGSRKQRTQESSYGDE